METHDLMAFRGTPMFCKAQRTQENTIIVNMTTDKEKDKIKIGDVVKWRDSNQDRYHEVLSFIEERPAKTQQNYNGPKLTFISALVHEVTRDFNLNYIGLKLS